MDPPTHVDLIRALCQTLSLPSHGSLAPDLTPADWGRGWITRAEAIALARRLLRDAKDPEWAAARSAERQAGWAEGYEAGWGAAVETVRRA